MILKVYLILVLAFAFLLTACEEPVETAHYYNQEITIHLKSGKSFDCAGAEQVEAGGWECRFFGKDDKEYPDKKHWFSEDSIDWIEEHEE